MRVNKRSEKYGVPWQAPSTVSRCPCCQARFGLTKRKHHCRMCGRVVCHGCSLIKTQVEGSEHMKRICDDCADDLEEQTKHSNSPSSLRTGSGNSTGSGGEPAQQREPTERRNLQQLLTLWVETLLKGQVGATTRFLAKGNRMAAPSELLKLMGLEMCARLQELHRRGQLRAALAPCSRALAEFFSAYLNMLHLSGGEMEPDQLCALATTASRSRALVSSAPELAASADKFAQVVSRIAHLLVDVAFLDVDEVVAARLFVSDSDETDEPMAAVLGCVADHLAAFRRGIGERYARVELVSVAAQRFEQSYLRRLFVAHIELDAEGRAAARIVADVELAAARFGEFLSDAGSAAGSGDGSEDEASEAPEAAEEADDEAINVEDAAERLFLPLQLVAAILADGQPDALRAAVFDLYAAFGRSCTAVVEALADALLGVSDFDRDALVAVCRADEEALVERIYEFQYGQLPKAQVRREPSPFVSPPPAPSSASGSGGGGGDAVVASARRRSTRPPAPSRGASGKAGEGDSECVVS